MAISAQYVTIIPQLRKSTHIFHSDRRVHGVAISPIIFFIFVFFPFCFFLFFIVLSSTPQKQRLSAVIYKLWLLVLKGFVTFTNLWARLGKSKYRGSFFFLLLFVITLFILITCHTRTIKSII